MAEAPELPYSTTTPALDEMNLVEIPFCVMTRTTEQRVLVLSPDGQDRLEAAESVGGLPTALGERILVALLYFSKRQNAFRSPKIQLPLRAFLSDYLYPTRPYRPNAATYSAVEEQLRRIAHTRLVSSRWWDKALGRHVTIDASIIDYIKVLDEGGGNRTKVLEIRWGELFFASLKARYTKPLDYDLWLRLERPLTRRLFRWLDRQLATKTSETVRAWQFARFKLGLTHHRLASPSRRASKYLIGELSSALAELRDAGFPVTLQVDSTEADYVLTFTRVAPDPQLAGELVQDDVTDLLAYFNQRAHGIPGRHFAPRDRDLASAWLETYGPERARSLVDACLAISSRRGHEKPFKFRRLSYYEDAAAGHLERVANERQGQLNLVEQKQEPLEAINVPAALRDWNDRFFAALGPALRATLQPIAYGQPTPPVLLFHSSDPTALSFLLRFHRDALLSAAQQLSPDISQLQTSNKEPT